MGAPFGPRRDGGVGTLCAVAASYFAEVRILGSTDAAAAAILPALAISQTRMVLSTQLSSSRARLEIFNNGSRF